MATFAEITDGVVSNVIVAENIEILQAMSNKLFIEYTEDNPAGIGWTYENGILTAPVVETPVIQVPAEPTV
jgi:hypothetical protein